MKDNSLVSLVSITLIEIHFNTKNKKLFCVWTILNASATAPWVLNLPEYYRVVYVFTVNYIQSGLDVCVLLTVVVFACVSRHVY